METFRVNEMASGNVHKGYRFRLIRPVDRFPDFVAYAGLTGAVRVVNGGIWARMDRYIPGAEAWDNELHWETLEDFRADTEAIR